MSFEPPPNIDLKDAFYDIISKIHHDSWNKFARLALGMDQIEMDEISSTFSTNAKEIKYQMLLRWQEVKGAGATVEMIYDVLNHFVDPENCPKPDCYQSSSELVNAYYDLMAKITRNDWNAFARIALYLKESDIDVISASYSGDFQEIKYRMFLKWQEKAGQTATVGKVQSIFNEYNGLENPASDVEIPDSNQSPSEENNLDPLTTDSNAPIDYCMRVESLNVLSTDPDFYKLARFQTEEIYPLQNHKKGWTGCTFILNNIDFFDGYSNRIGSEKDVEYLKELWIQMGSMVTICENLGVDNMKKEIKSFAEGCTACDYCVVIIMSRGSCVDSQDVFFGIDSSEPLVMDTITEMFDNKHSPHLQGIPKLFFFICSRGGKIDHGVVLHSKPIEKQLNFSNCITANDNTKKTIQDGTRRSDGATAPSKFLGSGDEKLSMTKHVKLPTSTDMLIVYGAQHGYETIRNLMLGSYVVNAIVNVFAKHAADQHVVDLMTKVCNKVSMFESPMGWKMMPEVKTTLRKKLFLYPGIKIIEE